MCEASFTACPLCSSTEIQDYFTDKRRSYLQCSRCCLVFVPPSYHLSEENEKRIYDLHENDPGDPGYRCFLSRLADPLTARLPEGAQGMDFGCGPGPALVAIFEERGFPMSSYDKYYRKDREVFNKKYDFISCTEVIEHLQYPASELTLLFKLLNPGGILALMTKMVINREAFASWHYIQDQSHICFYSRQTFSYIAEEYNCRLDFSGKDVIFLQKR